MKKTLRFPILCRMILVAVCIMTGIPVMHADEPFRLHRYSTFEVMKLPQDAIVFVGNSITDMHPWAEAFDNDPRVVNRGVSGALTHEVLQNMDAWLKYKPAKVFLMIGTNDLASGVAPRQVVNNIKEMLIKIRRQSPRTRVYLQGILAAKDQMLRSMESVQEVNKALKQFSLSMPQVEYVDLFNPLVKIPHNDTLSLDQLHLTAAGYAIWCRKIASLAEIAPVYDIKTPFLQYNAGLMNSHGMRASYFSMLPVEKSDILLFGDELVKCGEWNELLGDGHYKNRGTGWSSGGYISLTSAMVSASFRYNSAVPKAVHLYTGSSDVNSSRDMLLVKRDYLDLISLIKQKMASGKIFLWTLLPLDDNEDNVQRVKEFNLWLDGLAKNDQQLEILDVFSLMLDKKGDLNPELIHNGYLSGEGYRIVAQRIKSLN